MNNPLQHPQTIIDIIIGILRIYKSPRINYFINDVKYSDGCPKFIEIDNSQWWGTRGFNKDYVIRDNEFGDLHNFFQNAYSSEEKILLSVQKFSRACERESDYDRLLDLVFTLELLFGSGDADSIKHKILIRMINLLSDIRENRELLYNKMNDLYAARNVLVHGLTKKQKFNICISNLQNYETIIREALSVFILTMKANNLDYEGMLKKLDYDKAKIHNMDMTVTKWKN